MALLFLSGSGKRRNKSDWRLSSNCCLWVKRLCSCRLKTLVYFLLVLLLLSTIFSDMTSLFARSTDNSVTSTHDQQEVVVVQISKREAPIEEENDLDEFNDPVQIDYNHLTLNVQEVKKEDTPIKEIQVLKEDTPVEEIKTEVQPEGGKLVNNYVIYDREYLPKFQRFDVGKAKLRFLPEFKSPCFLEDNSGKHAIYSKFNAAKIK